VGRIYISMSREVTYEEYKKLKEQILQIGKELGFKVDDTDEAEVVIRFEE